MARAKERVAEPHATASGFAMPPRKLRSLHRPQWLGRIWSGIEGWARHPVRIRALRGQVLIEVLGLFHYYRRNNGTFNVYGRRFGDRSRRWAPVEDGEVAIVGVPFRDLWVRALAALVEAEGPHCERDGERIEEYRAWVVGQLAARVRREFDLHAIRREIAEALDANESVLHLARRIPRTCDPGNDRTSVRVDLYNRVALSYEAYRKLADQAPNLLPLHGVLSVLRGFPTSGEPVQRLRDFLWVRGVSPAAWRIVAKSPARLWVRHLGFYCDPIGEAALDILRLVDLLRGRDAPPPWFLHTLFAMRGNYAHRLDNVVIRWGPHMRTLQMLARLIEQADDSARAAMRDELHGILAWMIECGNAVGAKALRRYTWATFVRRADEWRRIDRTRASKSAIRWAVPFERTVCGTFEAVVLRNAFELWEEGQAMRHCVGAYDQNCVEGKQLVVSLRQPGLERPLCTALYDCGEEGWQLTHAAGFANSRPRDNVWRHLAHVAEQINALPEWRSKSTVEAPVCVTLWLQQLEARDAAQAEAIDAACAADSESGLSRPRSAPEPNTRLT